MKIVLLSEKEQYEAWRAMGPRCSEFTVLCDNPLFYPFLRGHGVSFHVLDQYCIQDKWQEINSWGCDRASHWIKLSETLGCFRDVNFAAQMHHHFSYVLVHALKNYYLAEYVFEKYRPSEVVIFEGLSRNYFPKFSSTFMLNYFLDVLCKEKGATKIPLAVSTVPKPLNPSSQSFKNVARVIVSALYRQIAKPRKEAKLFTIGAMRYLEPIFRELKERNLKVVYYDFEFHLDKWWRAFVNGVQYVVPECFPSHAHIDFEAYASKHHAEVVEAFSHAKNKGLFVYQGVDLGDFLNDYLLSEDYLVSHFRTLAEEANHFENILAATDVQKLLLDEDISYRNSFIAAYFRSRGKQVYALSHASFVVDFAVEPEHRAYALSQTFAHSEFEKYSYELRGWDPSHIRVTGTPRYDELYRTLKGPHAERKQTKKLKIFYCGASLFLTFPSSRGGYLGHSLYTQKAVQMPSLECFLEAIKPYPIEIVYKSRGIHNDREWRALLKRTKNSHRISLCHPKADIFKLIHESDVMVLSYWSTAILEAAMAGKPVLLIDLFQFFSRYAAFEKNKLFFDLGFCTIVRNKEELQAQLRVLCERHRDGQMSQDPIPGDLRQYFLGLQDGKNTERVLDQVFRSNDSFADDQESQSHAVTNVTVSST